MPIKQRNSEIWTLPTASTISHTKPHNNKQSFNAINTDPSDFQNIPPLGETLYPDLKQNARAVGSKQHRHLKYSFISIPIMHINHTTTPEIPIAKRPSTPSKPTHATISRHSKRPIHHVRHITYLQPLPPPPSSNLHVPFLAPLSACCLERTHPTTAFILKLSKNPLKSSFLTSTTQCSKLSMRTLAFVSSTTS